MTTEDQNNPNNKKLEPYNQFLRKLAKEKNCKLADLNPDKQAALADARKSPTAKGSLLTTDGVHMAFAGDAMMASGVPKSLGLDTKEMAKAKDAWLDLPNTNVFESNVVLTQRQAQKLEKRAASRNISLGEMIQQEINEHVLSLVKWNTPSKDFAARNIEGALGCLFLLSTGDDVHLPKVEAYLAGTRVEGSTWINGYNGILCAEYFLRTGGKAVMPLLQNYCDTAKRHQKLNSG